MAEQSAVRSHLPGHQALRASQDSAAWARAYLWRAAVGDVTCAVIAGVLAVQARFLSQGSQPAAYLVFTCVLPILWVGAVALSGGYDSRFIGVGSDEFRRLLNAAVSLTAAVAIVSYALKLNVARGYVALAMPSTTVLDLTMRYWLRKHLHRMRDSGQCLRRVVVVGHAPAIAELAAMLRRSNYHGMSIVGACLAEAAGPRRSRTSPSSAAWRACRWPWTISAPIPSRCCRARR